MSEHGCRLLDQLGYDAAACTAPTLCVARTADLLLSHAVSAALTPSNTAVMSIRPNLPLSALPPPSMTRALPPYPCPTPSSRP